jgi:pimeloyl-ACP methyl ester carboxylesterase
MKKKFLLKVLPYYFRTLSIMSPGTAARKAFRLFTVPFRIPRPPSEKNAYESSEKLNLSNGLRVYRWGSHHKSTVLLVHGWNGRGTQLRAFVPTLIEKGFQVLALDGPAHGESPGASTNPRDFTNAIHAVQKEHGDLAGVIAHSFGAGCSVLATSEGLKTNKLVLIASPCRYDQILFNFTKRIGLNKKAEKIFCTNMEKLTGRPVDGMNVAELGKINRPPTMIVHDNEDRDVPVAETQMLIQAWPEARALITTGLGHIRILRNKHVVEQVVNFIAKS